MSLRLQEKLLRVIEYGEFERLGGQRVFQVDVRVLAATHADLRALAEQGRFRHDLLDRLSFDVVHLPPLRYRPGDILELARHFAIQISAELGWDAFPGFTEDAVTTLEDHAWPGNVRELKNAVERSVYRWKDPDNPVDDIVIDPFASPYEDEQPLPLPAMRESKGDASPPLPFSDHMRLVEKTLLENALLENDNHQRRTAEALGLRYDQLRGLVRKHGLSVRKRRSS